MNRLEKIMIAKLLEPRNVTRRGNTLEMKIGALKMLPASFVPMLPLAEKCLGELDGVTDVSVRHEHGLLAIGFDSARLTEKDVVQWYRLVFREALNETDSTSPERMTDENARHIAARALRALGK